MEQLFFAAAAGFEAARQVTLLPEGHRSRRIHGHSFLARIRTRLPQGWASFPGGEVGDLQKCLAEALEPLDYRLLNEVLDQPTDENLVRWIRGRLNLRGLQQVGIQSTIHEGVELDAADHAHIWRRYIFEAAHQLPKVPPGHKCGRMHGHGFEVILHADQDVRSRDLGIDYDHLDACWAPIYSQLHHACLNDISGLENPTSELIARWIWERLKPDLTELSWVTVYETATCGAHYDGSDYRIWKELTVDSAVRLKCAPGEDPRHQVHGHSYTLRLHLTAPLDEVMGWTVDFGDVKEVFNPVYQRLDHHPLHELPGLLDADSASLAGWIRQAAAPELKELDRIDVYETRGCGAILSWWENGPALPV